MKVKIYNRGDEKSINLANILEEKLILKDIEVVESDFQLIICLGGDGTVIKALRENFDIVDKISFLGIKTGTLGFFCDYGEDEIDFIVDSLKEKEITKRKRKILEYDMCLDDVCVKGYAINEVTLINGFQTQVIKVKIDNNLFYTMRGTGVCISTPVGSTAYNKSLGGAILDVDIDAIQVTEIASINNREYRSLGSPFVISDKKEIELEVDVDSQLIFTEDNEHKNLPNFNNIKCRLSKKTISFATFKEFNFFDKIKKSFLS